MSNTDIKAKITTDPRWCERAILAIFDRQTTAEQETEETVIHNKMGFTAFDANKLSYYAKWIQSGRHLTGKYLEDAFHKIGKYAKQLEKISKGEL